MTTFLIILAAIIGTVLMLLGLAVVIYVFATWRETMRDFEEGM